MAEQQQIPGGDPGAEGKPSKSGGKTFLITAVLVVLVAVGAGAAAAYFFFPQVASLMGRETVVSADTESEPEPIEYGEFMELQGFMVNPSDSQGRRALMVNVGLEGADAKVLEAVTAKEIVVRDRILRNLSALSVNQLTDIGLRDSIKTTILGEINEILDEEEVSRLYFTAWILQ